MSGNAIRFSMFEHTRTRGGVTEYALIGHGDQIGSEHTYLVGATLGAREVGLGAARTVEGMQPAREQSEWRAEPFRTGSIPTVFPTLSVNRRGLFQVHSEMTQYTAMDPPRFTEQQWRHIPIHIQWIPSSTVVDTLYQMVRCFEYVDFPFGGKDAWVENVLPEPHELTVRTSWKDIQDSMLRDNSSGAEPSFHAYCTRFQEVFHTIRNLCSATIRIWFQDGSGNRTFLPGSQPHEATTIALTLFVVAQASVAQASVGFIQETPIREGAPWTLTRLPVSRVRKNLIQKDRRVVYAVPGVFPFLDASSAYSVYIQSTNAENTECTCTFTLVSEPPPNQTGGNPLWNAVGAIYNGTTSAAGAIYNATTSVSNFISNYRYGEKGYEEEFEMIKNQCSPAYWHVYLVVDTANDRVHYYVGIRTIAHDKVGVKVFQLTSDKKMVSFSNRDKEHEQPKEQLAYTTIAQFLETGGHVSATEKLFDLESRPKTWSDFCFNPSPMLTPYLRPSEQWRVREQPGRRFWAAYVVKNTHPWELLAQCARDMTKDSLYFTFTRKNLPVMGNYNTTRRDGDTNPVLEVEETAMKTAMEKIGISLVFVRNLDAIPVLTSTIPDNTLYLLNKGDQLTTDSESIQVVVMRASEHSFSWNMKNLNPVVIYLQKWFPVSIDNLQVWLQRNRSSDSTKRCADCSHFNTKIPDVFLYFIEEDRIPDPIFTYAKDADNVHNMINLFMVKVQQANATREIPISNARFMLKIDETSNESLKEKFTWDELFSAR
jgi:hypothetical protein